MFQRRRVYGSLLSVCVALAAASCGSSAKKPGALGDEGSNNGDRDGNSDGGTTGGQTSAGGQGTTAGTSAGTSAGSNGVSSFPVGDGSGCASGSSQVELAPLDLGLAVDTSYSMDFDGKWSQVKQALKSFASNDAYANVGVGLQFFPARATCSVTGYEEPVVGIATLPGAEPDFRKAVEGQRMAGGTPMVQVLKGWLGYLRKWAENHPDHRTVLVLSTDGIPDDSCTSGLDVPANSLSNAKALASEALSGTPSIPVFVIGVGSELSALDEIAEAGGSQKAILIDTTANVEQAFLDALDTIRKTSLRCDYAVPSADPTKVDYERVNVRFFESEGKVEFFYNVQSAADCSRAPAQSWYYDDPSAPTKVVLCPETCTRASAAQAGRVDVVFGCRRVDIR